MGFCGRRETVRTLGSYIAVSLLQLSGLVFSQEVSTPVAHFDPNTGSLRRVSMGTTAEGILYAQKETLRAVDVSARREFFLYTGIGFLEFMVLGVGYQINDDWAIAIKSNGVFLSRWYIGPNGETGVGIRISRFLLGSLFFNAIHIEPSYLTPLYGEKSGRRKGFSFQLTIGGENVDKNKIHALWSLGGVVSSATGLPPLFMLSAKIGLNWNF